MQIASIVGARPQFIKAVMVSLAIGRDKSDPRIEEVLIHTGQHFDANMSDVFFAELGLRQPDHHLGIGTGPHGQMTGRMLERVESILLEADFDRVVVYGDTNSTLAGALAAAKLDIPIAHVEAGLRSFKRSMPEEINRVVTDQLSDLLFAPSDAAAANLRREGVNPDRIVRIGDVMYDAMLFFRDRARPDGPVAGLTLDDGGYVLATVHRAENTDDEDRLRGIMEGLMRLAKRLPVVLPLHPRTAKVLAQTDLGDRVRGALHVIDPVGYLDMVRLESAAAVIATDSGGVQKEAYFNGVPCLTLRDETEWVELVEAGVNLLVGTDPDAIENGFERAQTLRVQAGDLYGDGRSAEAIVAGLRAFSR
jgi:UDP-GlcNAc3NAcA epimerase